MISKFTSYLLSIRGYSPRTAEGYAKDCKAFAAWAKANIEDARWSTLTRKDIDRYIMYRVENGIQPATTNRELSSISALYRYFIREGLLTQNPCRFQSRRKQAQRLPNTIPAEDLKSAYENTFGLVKVWIGLLATTGIRISELLSLRWEDIDFKACSLEIMGKGSKERIVYTAPEYLKELRAAYERKPLEGRIFDYDQRDARYMLYQALKPHSRAKQLSPHAIRHSYATNLAGNGVNVVTIATILGHSHIETTQKYIDLAQMDRKAAASRQTLLNA